MGRIKKYLVAMAVLVVGLLLGAAPRVNATGEVLQDGHYTFSSKLNQYKSLDVLGGSQDNGANLQLWEGNNTGAQRFIVRNIGGGYVEIENLHSGKLLDVQWGEIREGANVWQYEKNGTCAQRWLPVEKRDGAGYFSVAFASACNTNLYLDVAWGSTENGTNIQLYTGNDTDSQKFTVSRLVPQTITSGDYQVGNLDISGGSVVNGANTQYYNTNYTMAQAFNFEAIGDGFYKIRNLNSGKVLDVAGGVCESGTNVQQWEDNGTIAQQWYLGDYGNGYYAIYSRCGMLALDVAGGVFSNGSNIQIWEPNWSDAQKFRLTNIYEENTRWAEYQSLIKIGELFNTNNDLEHSPAIVYGTASDSGDLGYYASMFDAGGLTARQKVSIALSHFYRYGVWNSNGIRADELDAIHERMFGEKVDYNDSAIFTDNNNTLDGGCVSLVNRYDADNKLWRYVAGGCGGTLLPEDIAGINSHSSPANIKLSMRSQDYYFDAGELKTRLYDDLYHHSTKQETTGMGQTDYVLHFAQSDKGFWYFTGVSKS